MSVRKFCWLLNEAKFGKNDKEYFPRWLRRYGETVDLVDHNLSVTEPEVIQFSRPAEFSATASAEVEASATSIRNSMH